MIFAILAVCSLVANEALDSDMSSQERKKTGVYKLTDNEKAALQKWIDNNYAKRSQPVQTSSLSEGHATLQENLRNGRFIRLSDNTLWEIAHEDMPVTQGWITPVDIIVTQSGNSQYPSKLTNSVTGSSVKARKVQSVPPSAPAPKP